MDSKSKAASTVQAAFFDIDGTLTTGGDVWGLLIHSPHVKRWRLAWLYATGLPHYGLSRVGLVSQEGFRDRWVRLVVWLMSGWSEEQVQTLAQSIVQESLMPALRPDVIELLREHKAAGHHVVLASTMFDRIVHIMAQQVGADAALGTRVAFENGHCTGHVTDMTCSGGRKVMFAREYLAHNLPNVTVEMCAAYADSRSDIPFLTDMGYPVATYPDDEMRAAALAHGWQIFEGGSER